jgi:hypothetical protein
MAYDGWIEFNDRELINLSRTAQLANVLGIDTVWTEPSDVEWIEDALGGVDYDDITEAPWYDEGYPASAEFAGLVPLSMSGLDDSTTESTTIEYIGNGGSSGAARNKTLTIVGNVAVVALTSRGAEFGKRWLDRMLRGGGARAFCAGSDMRYFRFAEENGFGSPPQAHRRDVTLSRGTSVTRKRGTECSATWFVTFTLTANDPFEYGEEMTQFAGLGGTPATITSTYPLTTSAAGSLTMTEESCPSYDYSPIYDPLHPALVAPPTSPDFYPEGWALVPGVVFTRSYVRLRPVEPTSLNVVPIFTLTTTSEVRYARVSIWTGDSINDERCDPLWTAIISYLPVGGQFIIDGEQEASYLWDGVSEAVRRTDSLVYGEEARPVQWAAFNHPGGLLVTLDVPNSQPQTVRAALGLVAKSD